MLSVCLKENRILHYTVWILMKERYIYIALVHCKGAFVEKSMVFFEKTLLNKFILKLNIANSSPWRQSLHYRLNIHLFCGLSMYFYYYISAWRQSNRTKVSCFAISVRENFCSSIELLAYYLNHFPLFYQGRIQDLFHVWHSTQTAHQSKIASNYESHKNTSLRTDKYPQTRNRNWRNCSVLSQFYFRHALKRIQADKNKFYASTPNVDFFLWSVTPAHFQWFPNRFISHCSMPRLTVTWRCCSLLLGSLRLV